MPAEHLASTRRGSGPPLALVHGLGHRWQAWEPVLDELSVHHDVIALDLPGFGASPMSPGMAMDIPALAATVTVFLAAAGIDRPHVAGSSLGGAIALELAVTGAAASATAFAPIGFDTATERRRALAILRTLRANTFLPVPLIRTVLRSRLLRAVCFGPLVAHPARLGLERMVGDALAMRRGRGFARAARAGLGYRFAGATEVPVTIAWGDRDHILRPHQADRARARLPQARHVLLPGCGHVPMSDDPTLVASTILTTTGAARSA
jgi:pimeloyl-ACP methyl ester carboxylesterase